MARFATFHRLEHEKARSHLTMVRFPTCRWPEHEKARSHLTMVRFPTFHRPEHEKARSHLTMDLLDTFTDFRICWRRLKILPLTGMMENTGHSRLS